MPKSSQREGDQSLEGGLKAPVCSERRIFGFGVLEGWSACLFRKSLQVTLQGKLQVHLAGFAYRRASRSRASGARISGNPLPDKLLPSSHTIRWWCIFIAAVGIAAISAEISLLTFTN